MVSFFLDDGFNQINRLKYVTIQILKSYNVPGMNNFVAAALVELFQKALSEENLQRSPSPCTTPVRPKAHHADPGYASLSHQSYTSSSCAGSDFGSNMSIDDIIEEAAGTVERGSSFYGSSHSTVTTPPEAGSSYYGSSSSEVNSPSFVTPAPPLYTSPSQYLLVQANGLSGTKEGVLQAIQAHATGVYKKSLTSKVGSARPLDYDERTQ